MPLRKTERKDGDTIKSQVYVTADVKAHLFYEKTMQDEKGNIGKILAEILGHGVEIWERDGSSLHIFTRLTPKQPNGIRSEKEGLPVMVNIPEELHRRLVEIKNAYNAPVREMRAGLPAGKRNLKSLIIGIRDVAHALIMLAYNHISQPIPAPVAAKGKRRKEAGGQG